MPDLQRVFITGRSALTAAGTTADDTWNNLLAGQSGVDAIKDWQLNQWPCQLGGELKNLQPAKMLPDRKLIKVISRQDVLGINAAVSAVEQSAMLTYRDSLSATDAFNDRTAVYVGSPGNKYFQQYDFLPLIAKTGGNMQDFARQLFDEVHPMWLLRILPNNVLAYTGITYGFKGINHNITNHAVSGAQALIEAYNAIKTGQADRAVVVAYDMGIEPQAMFYYQQLGVLSEQHLKPFDRAHDGTLLADGAAAIVLESEASARARGAHCYAEMVGGLAASEAQGLFSIEAQGEHLSSLLHNTLTSAQLNLDDIGGIIAHGNGNPKSDDSEAFAISRLWQQEPMPVSAFKWATGHTLCASGLIDAVLASYAVQHATLPGIANLEHKAAACTSLSLSADHQSVDKKYMMVINRGFASMNACIVIKACE